MRIAVDLYDEALLRTEEINDAIANYMLAAEFVTAEL
jgi:hypothetical protein